MARITRPTRPDVAGFTVQEAARRTRMQPHRVRYYAGKWGRDGYGRFVTPAIADAGQGSAKVFNAENLVQLRVAFLLREAGLSEDATRRLFKAKGVAGQDWWNPARALGQDAVLLVRGEPEWPAPDRWLLCTTDLRLKPPNSWAAAVFQAAGPDCELVHARFASGWQLRFPNDRTDCWVLEEAREAWAVNVGQIRKAVTE
jgi:DNA-binding transcriptional MerR regulator